MTHGGQEQVRKQVRKQAAGMSDNECPRSSYQVDDKLRGVSQAHGWVKAFRSSDGVKAHRPVSILAEPERALALCVEVSSHSDDVTGSPACVPNLPISSMP